MLFFGDTGQQVGACAVIGFGGICIALGFEGVFQKSPSV